MSSIEIIAAVTDAGRRLDQLLVERVPAYSRSRIQALIKEGHVTVDGGPVKASAKVKGGERLLLNEPEAVPCGVSAQEIPLDVLFEDDSLIVVNKAPGMVVHPAAGNWEGTLVNALLHHCRSLSGIGGELRPGIVHRLDKETSGCLVAAKNDAAHQSLSKQFAGRDVTKIYLAIASGRFAKMSGIVDAPIARHPVHRKKMAIAEAGKGRNSKTSWRVLKEFPVIGGKGVATLVECTLHTGRTHQIRVHLKHLGHPLLGDEVYGKRAGYPRQMLHAWKLGFRHPVSGDRMEFTAPVPQDFLEAGGESGGSPKPEKGQTRN